MIKPIHIIFAIFWVVGAASPVIAGSPAINLYGTVITCTAANRQIVSFYTDPNAAAAARPLGGARADFTPRFGYTIAIDPQLINNLPPLGALLVIYHECAHVALPMGVGLGSPTQERNADCYAIQAMRKRGLLKSWVDFRQAMSAVVVSGGGHTIDSNRINFMATCFTQ